MMGPFHNSHLGTTSVTGICLDVPTDWESRLRRDHFAEPWGEAARQLAWSKAGDSERRAKIAAAQKGRPRPANVIEAMLTSEPVLFWPL